jgi:hypothetical protein
MRHFIWFYLFIIGLDFWLSTQTHYIWIKALDITGGLVWLGVFIYFFHKFFIKSTKKSIEK